MAESDNPVTKTITLDEAITACASLYGDKTLPNVSGSEYVRGQMELLAEMFGVPEHRVFDTDATWGDVVGYYHSLVLGEKLFPLADWERELLEPTGGES